MSSRVAGPDRRSHGIGWASVNKNKAATNSFCVGRGWDDALPQKTPSLLASHPKAGSFLESPNGMWSPRPSPMWIAVAHKKPQSCSPGG